MAIETHKSVGSWRDPCSTGQNCELMDPSSDLIALWKNNSSKSSSTGQFDWPIQLANGYRDPQVCGVLARPMFDWPELRADGPIFGSHCLVEEQLLQIKFDWPVRLANSTGQWLSRPTSPTNCDDPVHGSSPGEIVFRHMSVVQRGRLGRVI